MSVGADVPSGMDLHDLVGKKASIRSVRDTYRVAGHSVCLTLDLEGVGAVKLSFRAERGGDVWSDLRRAPRIRKSSLPPPRRSS